MSRYHLPLSYGVHRRNVIGEFLFCEDSPHPFTSSKASKRREEQLSRQEKEAEASRKRFAAKAEWAREFGEVPPEPVYNSRGGLGYSNPASNPEAELQGDTNSQRPAIDEPNPQTVADVERMARHTEYHMRSSKTVEYRPPKKDRDWSRTEKGAHHEDE